MAPSGHPPAYAEGVIRDPDTVPPGNSLAGELHGAAATFLAVIVMGPARAYDSGEEGASF